MEVDVRAREGEELHVRRVESSGEHPDRRQDLTTLRYDVDDQVVVEDRDGTPYRRFQGYWEGDDPADQRGVAAAWTPNAQC